MNVEELTVEVTIRRRRRGLVTFRVGPVAEQTKPVVPAKRPFQPIYEEPSVSVVLTDTQKTTFAIASAKDKKGNDVPPAQLGSFTWQADDAGALLKLTPSADTLSCDVEAVGPLGTAKLSCVNGDNSVSGAADVSVVSGAAVSVTLTNTPPVEVP